MNGSRILITWMLQRFTFYEWFKEFDKVSNKDRYEKLMALWLKENPLKINADMPKKKIIDKNK